MYLNHRKIYDVDKCRKMTFKPRSDSTATWTKCPNVYVLYLKVKVMKTFRFDRDVDRDTTFKHSTVLAMPIKHAGSPGRVLGVFQLVNKFDNLPFTRYIICKYINIV